MAATKAVSTIIAAATSNAAGATATGSVVNISTAYSATISFRITNGGTGPTISPIIYMYGSADNFATSGKKFAAIGGDTVANSVTEQAVTVPPDFQYIRADVTGNTGQAVTCEAFAHVTTGL